MYIKDRYYWSVTENDFWEVLVAFIKQLGTHLVE